MSLSVVLDLLACPVCGSVLEEEDRSLRCQASHAFDVARQGFVTLSREGLRHPGDGAEMVLARERVLGAGVLDPVTAALVETVGPSAATVLDVGAGTAHHTAAVVDAVAGRRGVALDSSKPALRRAARAHPRIGAVGADVVQGLPVADGVIDVVLVTFAPRNVEAFDRVLAPGGRVVVVTPGPAHLAEIAEPMQMLAIDPDKEARLAATLSPALALFARHQVRSSVELSRDLAADMVLMGPAGFHARAEEIAARAATLPDATPVTIEVTLSTFTRPDDRPEEA